MIVKVTVNLTRPYTYKNEHHSSISYIISAENFTELNVKLDAMLGSYVKDYAKLEIIKSLEV